MRDKGVTLFALIVTVIILLILAAVTIATLGGENGLFGKAREAADRYAEEQQKELDWINELDDTIGKLIVASDSQELPAESLQTLQEYVEGKLQPLQDRIAVLEGDNTALKAENAQLKNSVTELTEDLLRKTNDLDYTTTEQWTGRYWIDGRKIYQRTYSLGQLPNNENKYVPHGISGYDRTINMEGWAYAPSTDNGISLPSFQNISGRLVVTMQSTNIRIICEADVSHFTSAYVTIWYVCTNR